MNCKLQGIQLIDLETHNDDRGCLAVLEKTEVIPFPVRRVYFLYNTCEGEIRGKHAHKKLEQILVCVSGSCKVRMTDGETEEIVELSTPEKGLYISHAIWREMSEFSDDAVLLVLASEIYDESDYIRDYDQFLEYTKSLKKH